MVEILTRHGPAVTLSHCEDYRDGLGVNSRVQLAELTDIARDRINERFMTAGVTFLDPAQVWIGPDAQLGRDTIVWPQTHLLGACRIGEGCQLGPNSRLTNVVAGNDCSLDETVVNVGAGSITCNYDGKNKHATTIGDRTFIGSDTMMVAPVNIGADVVTGASSCITRDVPDGALAVERSDQRIVEGYTELRRARL